MSPLYSFVFDSGPKNLTPYQIPSYLLYSSQIAYQKISHYLLLYYPATLLSIESLTMRLLDLTGYMDSPIKLIVANQAGEYL